MLIDIIVLIVILISALIAFLRGAIREILTIFGTAGAFAAAYFFGPLMIPVMGNLIGLDPAAETPQKLLSIVPYELVATALAYGSVFLLVIITLSIASHMIAETAKSMGLGAIDRTAGVIFGIIRGILLLGLLNLPIYIFAKDTETRPEFVNTAISKSSTYFYIEQTSKFLSSFLPKNEDTAPMIEDAQEKLKTIEIPSTGQLIDKAIENAPKNSKNDEQTPEGYSEEFRDKMDELFEKEEN